MGEVLLKPLCLGFGEKGKQKQVVVLPLFGQQLAIFEPGILLQSEDGLDQPLPIALAEAVTLQDLSAHAGAIVAPERRSTAKPTRFRWESGERGS